MGERQALRIDYAHGTVPGTAFVIDEPFPIPPCGPRVTPGAAVWGEAPPRQPGLSPSLDAGPWERQDWGAPRFPDLGEGGGRFRQDEGRRPNGSFQRGPFRGGPRGVGGRGRGGDMQDGGGGFRGGRGMRPGMGGGFRARGGGPGQRGRGRGAEDADGAFRGRGGPQRGGPGGRGRGGAAEEGDGNFRGRGGLQRGGRGRGGSEGRGRGGSEDTDGAFRGRGGIGGRGRGGGSEDTDAAFRGRGGLPRGGARGRGVGAEDTDSAFRGRGGLQRGARRPRGAGPAGGRGASRGDLDTAAAVSPALQQGKSFTPKPLPKHATPGKILTSMIPPLIKRPPVSKFRNRFPDSDDDSSTSHSPSPRDRSRSPLGKAKSGSTGAKTTDIKNTGDTATKTGDTDMKTSDTGTKGSSPAAKSKSPAKEGASKRKSSSRTRSPGRKSSRTRSSSKSRSRRSRSRSRRSRSRSRRSRSRSRRRSRSSGHKARSRSRSPRRHHSPRVTRSPYRPAVQVPGQEEEGFGIRVQGFPTRSSDRLVQDGLYHEFKRYGKIISVDMHGCAEDRYAVVFYQHMAEREKALASFKGHCFFGRPVQMEPWDASSGGPDRSWDNNVSFRPLDERADEFHPRATKILFVGNLEKTLTREDLSTIFQRYGEILGIDLKKMAGLPNRFAFIQYIDIASVCRAIKEMDGELLRNTRLRLGFGRSKPTNCVWVDGLPGTLTEAQLTGHFSAHGTVLKLAFDPVKGVALVFFKTVEQAEAALKEARGQTVGGNRIKVDFANSRSQAAFFRVTEPGPEDGVDAEEEDKAPPPPFQEFKPSEIEAGDVLRKVLLV